MRIVLFKSLKIYILFPASCISVPIDGVVLPTESSEIEVNINTESMPVHVTARVSIAIVHEPDLEAVHFEVD